MPDATDRGALHQSHTDPDEDVPDGRLSPEEMLATLRQVTQELFRRSAEGTTPEEVRAWVNQAAAMRRRVVDLAGAYEMALHEESAGEVVARRIERMTRPHAKRIETERRRAEGGMYAGEKRSPNRPTQVEVDPLAWTVLKAHAVRHRKSLAGVVGKLLVKSFDRSLESLVQESGDSRPSAPDSAPRPRPERRFARLFIDDEDWLRFRERATRESVSVARLVGIVAEDEARALGWRPSNDPR